MLILKMVLTDIFSHKGPIWSQLLLGNKTDGTILVGGHGGWVQSRGKDYSLRRQTSCPSHGQQTGVQNKIRLLTEDEEGGGWKGGVDCGLSSK